jgi:hypothetical protein
LNILYVPDLAHFSDGRDLVGVRFDAVLGNDVPYEHSPRDTKSAFLWVQLNVELFEDVEGFFQVNDEVAAPSRYDDYVINIDLQVVTYLPLEEELHTPLISRSFCPSRRGLRTW